MILRVERLQVELPAPSGRRAYEATDHPIARQMLVAHA
jgi:hypothetical protein